MRVVVVIVRVCIVVHVVVVGVRLRVVLRVRVVVRVFVFVHIFVVVVRVCIGSVRVCCVCVARCVRMSVRVGVWGGRVVRKENKRFRRRSRRLRQVGIVPHMLWHSRLESRRTKKPPLCTCPTSVKTNVGPIGHGAPGDLSSHVLYGIMITLTTYTDAADL